MPTNPGQRAIVAVDGHDEVGETRLVGEFFALAPHVAGCQVLSVSVDGPRAALRPRAHRQTYYENAFDYDALRRGSRRRTPAHRRRRDHL